MSVPDKGKIIEFLSNKYSCKFTTMARKQIMFEGSTNRERIVVCTPSSKIHKKGSGWFDLKWLKLKFWMMLIFRFWQ